MQWGPRHSTLRVQTAYRVGLLLLLSWVSLPVQASGDDDRERPVRVEPVGTGHAEAAPGEIVSAAFRLTNPASEPRRVRADVHLPAEWSLLFAAPVMSLAPNERATRLLSFRVPAHTAPGTYEVRLRVRSGGASFQPSEGVLTVAVGAQRALEITTLDAPPVLAAGSVYEARFLLANVGNARLRLRLEAHARGGTVEVGRTEVELDAGAAQDIVVRVEAPSDLRKRQRHYVRLLAFVGDEEVAQTGATTELVPTGPMKDDGDRYPVEIALLAGGQRGGIGPQLQVASLPTKEPDRPHVDFLLRTPTSQPNSSFVLRDEYRFRYTSEPLALQLGDDIYALSPLTEVGVYGFGGEAQFRTPSRSFGGYYQQSRFPGVEAAQGGLRVEQKVADEVHVGLNLLSSSGFRNGEVASFESRFVPYVNAEVEAEVGASTGGGEALALRFGGGDARFRYETRYVRSTPEYVGTLRGTALRSVAVSGQPTTGFQLEGAWRDHRRTYTALEGAPPSERSERYGQAGARLMGRLFDRSTFLSLSAHRRSVSIAAPGRATEQSEHAARLRVGFDPHRLLTLRGGAEAGRARLSAEQAGRPFYRYDAQARLNVEAYVASFAVEHVRGAEIYAARDQRRWQLSTHVGARVGGATRIGADMYFSVDESRPDFRYVVTQFRVDHTLATGARLSVRSRFSEAGRGGSLVPQYAFAYTLPFGLDLGLSPRRAPLVGEVFDAATKEPVEGALVLLGDAVAMTDERGAFTLPAPEAGTHYLRLDPASIGLDRTTLDEMPMAVDIAENGAAGPLVLPVVESGTVDGRVVLRASEDQPSAEAVEVDLANVVLEASDGNGRYRTITDGQGRFLFTDLRPGPWTVRVVHAQLPERHSFERETTDVLVASGERATVEFVVRERQRTIEFIRSGTLKAN